MTTWAEEVQFELGHRGESKRDIISFYPSTFDFGSRVHSTTSDKTRFTLWTECYVYFPALHDGSMWCASAPRNPCAEATDPV